MDARRSLPAGQRRADHTAIVGCDMPELSWRYGYPSVMLFILVGAAVLHRLLRRAGWL